MRRGFSTRNMKALFHESFIREIPTVKQVYMKWDTDSFVYFFVFNFVQIYIYILDSMNILSEPLVNYIILWENHDLQFI